MKTSEFIACARAFNMGVTGGVREHPTKWRVVIHRATEPAIVLPFDSEDEAYAKMRDGAGHETPGWSGTHIETPEGYTPKRVLLPVYGQTPAELRYRELIDSWNFGRWLCATERRMERYHALVEFLDSETDPNLASIAEARSLLAPFEPEEMTFEPASDDDRSPFELTYGLCFLEVDEMLTEASEEWLAFHGYTDEPHVCFDALESLEPPDTGGIYFLLSVAPKEVTALKIGWSRSSIRKRIQELKTAHPWPLRLVAWIAGAPIEHESGHHRRFRSLRIAGSPGEEWFHFKGALREYVHALRLQLHMAT